MIDPRAVVDAKAELANDVTVGPFTVIGPDVVIDSGTWIGPHAVINGPTRIGRDNKIYQFASIGEAPQDKKYRGEPTRLEIGDRNVFRENCTIHRGTTQDRQITRIGNDNLFMAYVHVAHDCVLGDNIIMANGTSLAGHVTVDDHAILGGFTLVHQFCRLGAHSFSSFGSGINQDLPPYVTVAGHRAEPRGTNSEGLRRHGFSANAINGIRRAFKLIYRSGLRLEDAVKEVRELAESVPEVGIMADFIAASERGILR
jgi:UDP-N-acetylglucosamine acyltransferase